MPLTRERKAVSIEPIRCIFSLLYVRILLGLSWRGGGVEFVMVGETKTWRMALVFNAAQM